GPDSAFLRL
uniref:Extended FMRFamide-3 n=1 Tax=Namaquaphasma ookiepense TaxID=409167 RepID=FAR3_NAMOO|nr:RecName: Full=Extended FMRFamide-3; Short=FMRFa-3 [Namaquaphasma ookiepense]